MQKSKKDVDCLQYKFEMQHFLWKAWAQKNRKKAPLPHWVTCHSFERKLKTH